MKFDIHKLINDVEFVYFNVGSIYTLLVHFND